jgi:hypothetical protein
MEWSGRRDLRLKISSRQSASRLSAIDVSKVLTVISLLAPTCSIMPARAEVTVTGCTTNMDTASIRSIFKTAMSTLAGSALLSLVAAAASMAEGVPDQAAMSVRTFALVSSEDLQRWEQEARSTRQLRRGATGGCGAKGSPVAETPPAIEIVRPDSSQVVRSPVDIELRFSAAPGAHVVPTTFRVCYLGLLAVDITDRLVGHSALSDTGLQAFGATLPSGNHHLRLVLADDANRIGIKEVSFRVY